VSPVADYLAVYAAIMIPTAVPSVIVLSTDNDRSAFTVDPSKTSIVVSMANPHVDILRECGECDAQSTIIEKTKSPLRIVNLLSNLCRYASQHVRA
jgi:hypothetical protein